MPRRSLRKNRRIQRKERRCHKMGNKLAEVVDKPAITEKNDDEKMCSCGNNVVDKMCSTGDFATCGDCGSLVQIKTG
jgi:hypothetical protein